MKSSSSFVKIKVQFGVLFFSLLLSLPVFALDDVDGPPAFTALPESFLRLHVSIPASCELYTKMGRDPDGPFTQNEHCSESELRLAKFLEGTVYRVVDGDTIHFYVGKKLYGIRMLGIDTPELHYRSRAQATWGVKARDKLRSMVGPGDKIKVVFDKEKCDHYGRVLGHVYKGRTNLNFEMVKSGHATNYCIAPNFLYCDEFANAYLNAARDGLASHRDKCYITPYVWRRGMDNHLMDKKVKNRKTGLVYSPADYYKVPVADRVFYP